MGKNQHVVPRKDGSWGVRGENNAKLTSIHDTQKDAYDKAREIAINQKSEVFTHDKNNKFRDRNSYGNDPFPPKG